MKTPKTVFIANKGKIIEHKVLISHGDFLYIDKLNELEEVVKLRKDELGSVYHDSFDEAVEHRKVKVQGFIDMLSQEQEDLSEITKSEKGDIKPERLDEN